MYRRRLGVLGMMAALLCAGCMQLSEEITLHPDGTVDLKYSAAVSDAALRDLKGALGELGGEEGAKPAKPAEVPALHDQAEIGAAFARLKDEGVTLASLKVERKDGWQRLEFQARCRDLLAAGLAIKAAGADTKYTLLRNGDGSWTLGEERLDPADASQLPGDRSTEEERKAARERCRELRMATAVNLPGDVTAGNATERRGRTAAWKLDGSDEKFFEKAKTLAAAAPSVTFKAEGLTLAEVGRHRYILEVKEIVLKADGSLTVTEKRSAHEQMLREIRGLGRASGKDALAALAEEFEEARVREEHKRRLGEGAELVGIKCTSEDGWKRSAVSIRYRDLAAAQKGLLPVDCSLKRDAEGNYRLTLEPGSGLAAGMLPDVNDTMLQYLETTCALIRKSWQVTAPGKVLKGNAHSQEDKRAAWSFAKGDADLRKKLKERLAEGMHVTFSGQGLDLKECASSAPEAGAGPQRIFGFRDGGGRKEPEEKPAEDGAPPQEQPAGDR